MLNNLITVTRGAEGTRAKAAQRRGNKSAKRIASTTGTMELRCREIPEEFRASGLVRTRERLSQRTNVRNSDGPLETN
jgi:hypothetical protein